jgi:hypothetical protein
VKITGRLSGPSWKNETPYSAESKVPIPRAETKTPAGVDRVNIFGYHKLPVLNTKLKGALLKKAFLILSGLLLLAGCSGLQYPVSPKFFSPDQAKPPQHPPVLLADRGGRPDPGSPQNYPLAGIQPERQPSSPPESEVSFCFPETDSFFLGDDAHGDFLWPLASLSSSGGEEEDLAEPLILKGSFALLKTEKETLSVTPSSVQASPQGPPQEGENNDSEAKLFPFPNPDSAEEPFPVDRCGEMLTLYEMEATSPTLSPGDTAVQETSNGDQETAKILSSFPSILNDKVKSFIDLFQTKADSFFTRSLARSQAYEGMVKRILREKNLPEELFYLPLIESGYNPYAQSRAKATGIWQFMNRTGKRYGLKVNKWVDERRDPEKSTYAAAEYLKDLYEMFNCWYLAAAGYNAGEGKVLQAMKRAKSQDFWEISKHRYLKRETKQYVPRFLAAMIIAQNPEKYGFSNIDYHPPLVYEKVAAPPGTRLDRIARAAEMRLEELRALNPALRRDKTPPESTSFEINLPPGKKEVYERNFSRVFKLNPRTARKHRVRRGDTLWQIAKKYRVDLQEICEGNEINPKAILRPGDTLLLPP